MMLGHLDEAVARSDEALLVARQQTNRPYHLAIALNNRVGVDRLRAGYQAVHERAVELAAVSAEHALPLFASSASLYLAERSARGETADGLARARQAYSALAATVSVGLTQHLLGLASCCERAGEVDQALELLDTALERVNATDERFCEAELHRLKGEWVVAYRRARLADAEDCFQRALAVARQQQAKFWELRAATSMARLWRNQGKRDQARDLLAPVYGWFTEGFDTLDLKEAKALLDELAS
jgi:predicted ATPase